MLFKKDRISVHVKQSERTGEYVLWERIRYSLCKFAWTTERKLQRAGGEATFESPETAEIASYALNALDAKNRVRALIREALDHVAK